MTLVRDNTRKLHQDIIEDYYEFPLSYSALASKYGRSESMIRKLIQRDRNINGTRERSSAPKDPRIIGEQKPISFRHFCIGFHVTKYIETTGVSKTMFGVLGKLALSAHSVAKLMGGVYDPTLSEMEALSAVLGITEAQLMASPSELKETTTRYAY